MHTWSEYAIDDFFSRRMKGNESEGGQNRIRDSSYNPNQWRRKIVNQRVKKLPGTRKQSETGSQIRKWVRTQRYFTWTRSADRVFIKASKHTYIWFDRQIIMELCLTFSSFWNSKDYCLLAVVWGDWELKAVHLTDIHSVIQGVGAAVLECPGSLILERMPVLWILALSVNYISIPQFMSFGNMCCKFNLVNS